MKNTILIFLFIGTFVFLSATDNLQNIYHGEIGNSHFVMSISIANDKVQGSYYYSKFQKSIKLNGSINCNTNIVTLNEYYNGENTGYFNFVFSDDKITGYWAKDSTDNYGYDFEASRLEFKAANQYEFNLIHEQYEVEHIIMLFSSSEKRNREERATDQLIISNINNEYYSFKYRVVGSQLHIGAISGIAKIQTNGTAIWQDGEGAELIFSFKEDIIEINAIGTEHYGGSNAYFGVYDLHRK